MPSFDDLAARRRDYTESGHPTFVVQHAGAAFTCFVLPQSLCVALPNFAMQMVQDGVSRDEVLARPDETSLFAVSASVPPRYRPYAAAHEMIEYVDGRTCLQATLAELELLWTDVHALGAYHEYVGLRFDLFESLLPYVARAGYPADKQQQFAETYRLLRHIAATRR